MPNPHAPNPDVRAKLDQARALAEAGDPARARALLLRLMQQQPREASVANMLAGVLMGMGERDSALHYARRAVELSPRDANAMVNCASLLLASGDAEGARGMFERAGAAEPAHPEALVGIASTLLAGDRLDEALTACDKGRALAPNEPRLRAIRGKALLAMGLAREAAEELRSAVRTHPRDLTLLSLLGSSLNYAADGDAGEARRVHLGYGRALALEAPARRDRARTDPAPERKLRVGLVSSDLRRHAVASFVGPLLEGGDGERMEMVCYFTGRTADDVTERLAARAAGWRACAEESAPALAEMIRRDRIDILIDLHGHTSGHRLAVFQVEAAPVQATWLGYPNTTGVQRMGYRIVDSLTDPPGAADELCTERLARIDPCFVCYAPMVELPEIVPRQNGPMVLGSFGAMAKLGEECLRLWAGALAAAPGSRLVLKNHSLACGAARESLRRRLEELGVAASRVEMLGPAEGLREHMAAYSRVDIALDTFPYNGTTTTCEALAMGVPVATMAGAVHASRVGESLLTAAGLGELVARDAGGFAGIVSELAGDARRLAEFRAGLRERVMGSALGDARAFAGRFEGALRGIWREWCARERGGG
jgi:protein O-GlcNAc transferase